MRRPHPAVFALLAALAAGPVWGQAQPAPPASPAPPRALFQPRPVAPDGTPAPPPRLVTPPAATPPRAAAPGTPPLVGASPVQATPARPGPPGAAPAAPPAVFYPGQVPGQPPKAPPRVGDELHDTRWRAETIGGRPVLEGKEPTLEFLRDDYLRGGTGCNRYVGPWATRASRVVFGPLNLSRMACTPDLGRQERLYLDTLEKAERMELREEGRVLLVHSAASKQPSRFARQP